MTAAGDWNEYYQVEEPAVDLLQALGYKQHVPAEQLQGERER